jgi:glycerate dehydrogenase
MPLMLPQPTIPILNLSISPLLCKTWFEWQPFRLAFCKHYLIKDFTWKIANAIIRDGQSKDRFRQGGSKMKIVVLDGYTTNPGDLSWSEIAALGDLTVFDRTPPALTAERIDTAEAVLSNDAPIGEDDFAACPSLRYIGVMGTGYNHIDTTVAARRGVLVTHVPTYGTMAVAQHTIALLLEACHHAGAHDASVHAGDWTNSPDFCYWKQPLIELDGKTLGLIGFGRIGQAVARIAQALGMSVLAVDEVRNPARESTTCRYASLDEVLTQSDVISLHCPLTPDNRRLINRRTIARMKDGVVLINTARGLLIDESDLKDALESGKVACAAVDVASSEPIQPDNPLLAAPRCIITPHIAWAPRESRARLIALTAANLGAFIAGRPVNAVNFITRSNSNG